MRHAMTQGVRLHREMIGVLALFALLTVVISAPVLVRVDEVLIGSDNDVMINPWADWWTLKTWQEPDITLYQTDYLFYPHGANLVYHSFSHLNTLVSLALRPLLGIIPAYNLTMLLNIFLAGVAMCHLARYLTGSTSAGVIAGVIFAFNSYSIYQTAHPVLVTTWPLPWATLSLWWAMQGNNRKWAVVAGLFVFLAAAASTLLLILCGIWFTFLSLYLAMRRAEPRPSRKILVTFALSTAVLVLPLLLPLLRQAILYDNDSFLVDPDFPLVADMLAPLTPQWVFRFTQDIYLGAAAIYLLMRAVGSRQPEVRLWLILVVVAYLFSIGPRPRLLNNDLGVTLPWAVPITAILREPHRWNILLGMGVAMLGAYGWLVVRTKLQGEKRQRVAAAFLILAIFGEYTVGPFPYTRPQVSPFYTEVLAQEPPEVAVAILPTGRQEDKKQMYYQTLHGHKMVGGVISRASEATFAFIYSNPLLRAGAVNLPPAPIPEDVRPHLQALAENNIVYLILDKTMLDVEPWRDAFPFAPVYEDDLLLVYETDPE